MRTRLVAVAVIFAVVVGSALLFIARRPADRRARAERGSVGSGATLSTTRESLDVLIVRMRARVASDPGDGEAAVLFADALMRAARVNGDAALPLEAERAIRATLAHEPGDYTAQRMLGVVLLAQHRFAEALTAAHKAEKMRPDDAWNRAVAGDALLELGRYEEAFEAFDELNQRRPDAAGYARAAYARELQGDLESARRFMGMAVDATGAHDPEAHAWYLTQLGHLDLLEGRLDDAERNFRRAEFVFPGHPYGLTGRARVLIARRQFRPAYELLALGQDTPETLALRGDIARRLGDSKTAKRAYDEAEQAEREGWKQEEPQPAALARFLAERRLNVNEAVALAERAATARRDIHTMDALAWAYFQAGRLDGAATAIAEATRTGTRDPRIRCHAEAIAATALKGLTTTELCDPLDLVVPTSLASAAGQSARPQRP